MNLYEKTISSRNVFSGKIIDVRVDTVELPDGQQSTREIVTHQGAVAVVPILESNYIVMVEQFRKPLERALLEIPAGKLDTGETPEVCGVRELREETGYRANVIKPIGMIHTTPGFSNEIIHLFLATELIKGTCETDSDEFINTVILPFEKVMDMILKGDITDSKTINAIMMSYFLLYK